LWINLGAALASCRNLLNYWQKPAGFYPALTKPIWPALCMNHGPCKRTLASISVKAKKNQKSFALAGNLRQVVLAGAVTTKSGGNNQRVAAQEGTN